MLNDYLTNNFPGLKLRKPLFYSWDIGLRFELGDPNMPWKIESKYNEEYFNLLVSRAEQLFSKAFDHEDVIVVVLQAYCYGRKKLQKRNYLFSQIENFNSQKVIFSRVKSLYEDDNGSAYWRRATIEIHKEQLNPHSIFKAISNIDFGDRTPRASGELYFIGPKSNVIFNMYDDRGLDIIATGKKALLPIYTEFKSWILDYDRGQIDQTFKNT